MPRKTDRDPDWEVVQERIAEALAPFAPEIAGRECIHGNWMDCDEDDGQGCLYNETRPIVGSMPVFQDFVLVAVTADMGDTDGEQQVVVMTAPNQRNTTTKGLLHVALHE